MTAYHDFALLLTWPHAPVGDLQVWKAKVDIVKFVVEELPYILA